MEGAQTAGAAGRVDHTDRAPALLAGGVRGDDVHPGGGGVVGLGEIGALGDDQRCAGHGGAGLGDDGVPGLSLDDTGPHRGVRDPHVGLGLAHGGARPGDAEGDVGRVDLPYRGAYAGAVDGVLLGVEVVGHVAQGRPQLGADRDVQGQVGTAAAIALPEHVHARGGDDDHDRRRGGQGGDRAAATSTAASSGGFFCVLSAVTSHSFPHWVVYARGRTRG